MLTKVLIAVIVVLSLVCITLLVRMIMIRSSIRNLREELAKTRDADYNRQLSVPLVDGELSRLTTEINNGIEYQKGLKLEEAKSRRQLEQSISDIAHDLRTPLTVVKGNLQMLENEDLSPKGREYLEISRKKSESLKGMVDEFFELSVLESETNVVEMEKIDLVNFLSEFIIENEAVIRGKNLEPEITFPEKSVFVQANKEMLSRVFSNLIGNILKYARDSFELSVQEKTEEDGKKRGWIRIGNTVDDPEAIDIEHIFDRTYRADKARSDGSAGLGLYIAKLLTEKQKGSIEAVLEDNNLYFDIVLKN